MKNLRSAFNSAASCVVRGFVKKAGLIAGLSGATGSAGFMIKDYLQGLTPHLGEQLSGALFLTMNGLLVLTDKYPRLKVPAGILGLLGTTAMGYGAIGQAGASMEIIAAVATGLLTLSMIFEKSINKLAHKMADTGKSVLKKIFSPLAKYPVATTAVLDITCSTIPLGIAAYMRSDPIFMMIAGIWTLGGIAIFATDNSVKKAVLSPRAPKALTAS